MSTFEPIYFLAGALLAIIICMLVLLVLQWRSTRQVQKLTWPAYEYVVTQAEHEAEKIIAAAKAQARTIVTEAEAAGQRTLGQYEATATQLQQTYAQQLETTNQHVIAEMKTLAQSHTGRLESFVAEALATVTKHETNLNEEYAELLAHFKEMTGTLQSATEAAVTDLQVQLTQVKVIMAEKLTQESEMLQTEVTEHLSAMLSKAEDEISAYRRARLALLDTHIERLVEDVVKQILHRRLSVDEHAELARQALEEAKTNNVL